MRPASGRGHGRLGRARRVVVSGGRAAPGRGDRRGPVPWSLLVGRRRGARPAPRRCRSCVSHEPHCGSTRDVGLLGGGVEPVLVVGQPPGWRAGLLELGLASSKVRSPRADTSTRGSRLVLTGWLTSPTGRLQMASSSSGTLRWRRRPWTGSPRSPPLVRPCWVASQPRRRWRSRRGVLMPGRSCVGLGQAAAYSGVGRRSVPLARRRAGRRPSMHAHAGLVRCNCPSAGVVELPQLGVGGPASWRSPSRARSGRRCPLTQRVLERAERVEQRLARGRVAAACWPVDVGRGAGQVDLAVLSAVCEVGLGERDVALGQLLVDQRRS